MAGKTERNSVNRLQNIHRNIFNHGVQFSTMVFSCGAMIFNFFMRKIQLLGMIIWFPWLISSRASQAITWPVLSHQVNGFRTSEGIRRNTLTPCSFSKASLHLKEWFLGELTLAVKNTEARETFQIQRSHLCVHALPKIKIFWAWAQEASPVA